MYIDWAKAIGPAYYTSRALFDRLQPYSAAVTRLLGDGRTFRAPRRLTYGEPSANPLAVPYPYAMPFRVPTRGRTGVKAVSKAGAVSRSSFAYKYGRRGQIAGDEPTKTLESMGTYRLTSGTGRQSNDVFTIFSRDDLAAIDTQWQGGGTVDNEYTVLRSSSLKFMITNQTQATGRYYIYDWVCRNSTDTNPAYMWNDDLKEQFGETFDVANVIPHKPTQSPSFRYHFKIKSVKTIVLEPGAIHEHIFVAKANAILYQKGYVDGPQYIGGLTAGIIIVTHGFPVNDSSTVNDITTCDIISDLMWFKKLNSTYITTQTKQGAIDNLPDNSITPRTIMLEAGNVENVDAA